MRTIAQMVQQEVMCCMSSMVSTLAQGYGLVQPVQSMRGDDARDGASALAMLEQAFELACAVPDYEEAAVQAGWYHNDDANEYTNARLDCQYANMTWQELCEHEDIEPYDREVFEHWAVSPWFAEKLLEQGEKVNTDFAGLNIWARTTTGQGIASDGVVERIHAAMINA